MASSGAVSGSRVLVVDDDPDIRELLCAVLQDDGWEARPAANGKAALAVLEHWNPDLIVLDLMMPVMDGWTFADRMHERWQIPIVVLSAANNVAAHAQKLGAVAVVPKPFDIAQLLPTLQSAAGGASP
jgi:CheY-like chemotaxis protein